MASQLKLRLPPDLKAWLDVQSQRNVRSLNAEVVFHLQCAKTAADSIEPKAAAKAG
jgi:hypothetical protein